MIAAIQKLPADQQSESKDEQKWETSFAATTNDQWDRMAAMVRQEIVKGEAVVPLGEFILIA